MEYIKENEIKKMRKMGINTRYIGENGNRDQTHRRKRRSTPDTVKKKRKSTLDTLNKYVNRYQVSLTKRKPI